MKTLFTSENNMCALQCFPVIFIKLSTNFEMTKKNKLNLFNKTVNHAVVVVVKEQSPTHTMIGLDFICRLIIVSIIA